MQSMVIGLPDETIFDFVCRGLSELPGVAKVLYVRDGAAAPEVNPGLRQCLLRVAGRPPRGLIELEVTEPSALAPYLGYLDNFCATLTLILEERDQRHRIEEQQLVLEQRVAERTQALAQSETRYRTLANDLPALICEFLPDSTLTYVNDVYCHYFGMPREALIGQRFFNLIPAEAVAAVQQEIASLTPDRPTNTCKHAVVNDGRQVWHEWMNRAFFDDSGQLLRIQGVGFDISVRREAEIELTKAKLLFERAFRDNPSLMAISEPETGQIIDVNNTWLERMGLRHEEMCGKSTAELGLFPRKEACDALIDKLLNASRSHPVEVEATDKDGHAFFGEASGEIIHVDSNRFLYVTIQDLTRQRELALRLEREATHDALTGLSNRQFADGFLSREVATADRLGHPLALLIVDLDNFKQVNDRFGHLVGDRVLKEVTARLGTRVRQNDLLARWGGEEFIVALPGTDQPGALRLAEALRRDIELHPFETVGTMTLCIGLSMWRAGESIAHWINRADHALYDAKRRGRNQVCMAKDCD
jgi:diguanylate cyclase (GGDEF)-like protein/PAS domain S-box-containing protein